MFFDTQRPRRRAFTLIELLIVISIIALLAAILFPVFSRVRENARRSGCQSNLKQLNLGMMQYIQDYDERFPLGLSLEGSTYKTSLDAVYPYLRNGQVAVCPSDSDPPSVDLGPYLPGPQPVSYTANDKVCTAPILGPSGATKPPVSLADVKQPSNLPLLWDAYIAGVDPDLGVLVEVQRRHFEGANCAFVDGHVKWYQTHPPLSDPKPDKADAYWNADPSAEVS